MDREHLMALAKDAGLPTAWISETGVLTWADLEHFVTLAIAYEREACAKVSETLALDDLASTDDWPDAIAAAIRSRT